MRPSLGIPLLFTLALTACSDRVSVPTEAPVGRPGPTLFGERPDAPWRTGFVPGPDGQPLEVRYQVVGGRGIYEGDIDLGPVEEIAATPEELTGGARHPEGPRFGSVHSNDARKWPAGYVPYVIESTVPNQWRVTDAMAHIEAATVHVDFIPRTYESDYIIVRRTTDPNICGQSQLGKVGGAQVLLIHDDCYTDTAIHELGHALGLWHEQSRCDRDTYVEILWNNIESESAKDQFKKRCASDPLAPYRDGRDVGEYSELSIMHYYNTAFGKKDAYGNRMVTIQSKRGAGHLMGSSTQLHATDVQAIDNLYPVPVVVWPQPRVRIDGPTNPRVGSLYSWTAYMEQGSAQTINWYRDRVLVASNTTTYYGYVSAIGTFELLVEVYDPVGQRGSNVKYVYPCQSGMYGCY